MESLEKKAVGLIVEQQTSEEKSFISSEDACWKMFEKNPHPIWIYDCATLKFLVVNEAAIEHYGYSQEEFLGMTLKDIRPQEDIPALLENISHLNSGLDHAGIWRHKKKDGILIDVEINSYTFTSQGRKVEMVMALNVTAAKEAEEERDRFFQLSLDMLCIAGMDGYFKRLNLAFERILGFTTEELLSKPFFEFVHLDDREDTAQALQRLVEGQTVIDFENRYRCKDGSYRWIQWRAAPYPEKKLVYAVARDITERKQVEKQMRFIQFVMDHAREAIFLSDSRKRFVYVNESACRSLGYTREELLKLTIPDISVNHDPGVFKERMDTLKKMGWVEYQSLHRTKEGREFPIDIVVNQFQHGGEDYTCGFVRDISDRLRSSEKLRESEQWLRTLVEYMPVVCFSFDREGNLLSWNHAAECVYGYTKEEAIGANGPDLAVTPETKKDTYEVIAKVFRGESVTNCEWKDKNKDGELGWRMGTAFPIFKADGSVECGVNLNIDITDRKRAEEALLESERQLRRALEERTRLSEDLHDHVLQSLFSTGLLVSTSKDTFMESGPVEANKILDQAVQELNGVIRDIRQVIGNMSLEGLKVEHLGVALKTLVERLNQAQGTQFEVEVDEGAVQLITKEESIHFLNIAREAASNCLHHAQARTGRVVFKKVTGGVILEIQDDGKGFDVQTIDQSGYGLGNMEARAHRIGGKLKIWARPQQGTKVTVELPKPSSYHGR